MKNILRSFVLILIGSALAFHSNPAHAQRLPEPKPFRADRPRPFPKPLPLPGPVPQFGDPLPGLTAAQLEAFATGATEFENVETPESGLGPIYNDVSCVACHSVPATGGSSDTLVTRFGRLLNGHYDPLTEKGGSLLQKFAITPAAQEVLPREANVIVHRQATALFGVGLIEAIPDEVLRQNAARLKPDGIRGHAAQVLDVATGQMRIGRFGWKAQQATLLAFSGDAYLNEMGITSRLFPTENAPNGNTNLLALYDLVADPEDQVDPVTGKGDIDVNADFMRLLGPPPPLPLTPSARSGQALFNQIGCAVCHEPTLFTAPNAIAALSQKAVPLFSDLLLHDMGSLNDHIAQGDAGPYEMKTAPLWGLRASAPYLHDGRAATVDQAIVAHDGEGLRARVRYQQLTPTQRRQLLDFLNSN